MLILYNTNIHRYKFLYFDLLKILSRGVRQNQRISVREMRLLPRHRPSKPPMLLMRLMLKMIMSRTKVRFQALT